MIGMHDQVSIAPQRPWLLERRVGFPAARAEIPALDTAREASGTLNAPMAQGERARRLAEIAADGLAESRRNATEDGRPMTSTERNALNRARNRERYGRARR